MKNYRKGYLYVNGHLLGRYWELGPQERLFCPGVWLKQGVNEVLVFELLESGLQEVKGVGVLREDMWLNIVIFKGVNDPRSYNNIEMKQEIEGAVDDVKSFYGASRRFLEVCEKPDVAGNIVAIQSSRRSPPHALSDLPSWEVSATSSNCSSFPLTTSSSADPIHYFIIHIKY